MVLQIMRYTNGENSTLTKKNYLMILKQVLFDDFYSMLLQDLLIFKLNYYEIREKQERVQISKGNPYKREKDYHVLKMSWKN